MYVTYVMLQLMKIFSFELFNIFFQVTVFKKAFNIISYF